MQASAVLLFDATGHLLMLRRGPTAPTRPGEWNLPGGYLKAGEKPAAGAARELAEESGVCLDHRTLFWVRSYTEPNGVLIHLFSVRLPHRPVIRFPDGEHDAYRWVRLP